MEYFYIGVVTVDLLRGYLQCYLFQDSSFLFSLEHYIRFNVIMDRAANGK